MKEKAEEDAPRARKSVLDAENTAEEAEEVAARANEDAKLLKKDYEWQAREKAVNAEILARAEDAAKKAEDVRMQKKETW